MWIIPPNQSDLLSKGWWVYTTPPYSPTYWCSDYFCSGNTHSLNWYLRICRQLLRHKRTNFLCFINFQQPPFFMLCGTCTVDWLSVMSQPKGFSLRHHGMAWLDIGYRLTRKRNPEQIHQEVVNACHHAAIGNTSAVAGNRMAIQLCWDVYPIQYMCRSESFPKSCSPEHL